MVKPRRSLLLLLATVVVLAVVWWFQPAGPGRDGVAAGGGKRAAGARDQDLPRIGLSRLEAPRPAAAAGRRDLFDFGQAAPPQTAASRVPVAPPPVLVTPPPGPLLAVGPAAAQPVSGALPALSVKYVGTLELKGGLRVAILMTDRKEILTGQAGETVANRLKIVKIGYESVDVQDVGSDRVRRIPFKGN